MTDIKLTDDAIHAVLDAALRNDLWREHDGVTTNEYRHEHFGFSDPIRDATGDTAAAEAAGLVELKVVSPTVARWMPTAAGEAWLAEHVEEDL